MEGKCEIPECVCHSGDIIIQKERHLLRSASTVSVLRAPVLSSVHVRLFPVEILLSTWGILRG